MLLNIMVAPLISTLFTFSIILRARGQNALKDGDIIRYISERNTTLKSSCPRPQLDEAPLWCPYSYHLLYLDRWIRVCKPSACVEFKEGDVMPELPEDVCLEHSDHQLSIIKLCRKNALRMHNVDFLTCSKVTLTDLEYEMQGNGSLRTKKDKTILQLGDYFMFENRTVLICNGSSSQNEDNRLKIAKKDIIPWCIPIPEANEEPQKSLVETLVQNGHSILGVSNTSATVCVEVSLNISTCDMSTNLRSFYGAFEIDNNQTLIDLILLNEFYFGDYFLDHSFNTYYYCHINTSKSKASYYLFGAASILSGVCLLLTIGIHVLYPQVNYNSRALLCHAICLFICYVPYSAVNMSLGAQDRYTPLLTFTILIIFLSSAFLWLNVLVFELWRGFSKMTDVYTRKRRTWMVRDDQLTLFLGLKA